MSPLFGERLVVYRCLYCGGEARGFDQLGKMEKHHLREHGNRPIAYTVYPVTLVITASGHDQ